jgi:hypothetical protein
VLHGLIYAEMWEELQCIAWLSQSHSYILDTGKSKAIPVTGCGDPQDCEMLILTHFLDSRLTHGS